jgi:cephalosporin hydroxylase
MLIWEIKPDLVIEIGTHMGGQALYLSDLQEAHGGVVHTIDIPNPPDCVVSQKVIDDPRITRFTEGWEQYDVLLARDFKKIMVIDDGCHTYSGVSAALDKFSKIVSLDSYYIVEDGILGVLNPMSEELRDNPACAVEDFLCDYDRGGAKFVLDREYCDFFGRNTTFNTIGYLRKVRR